MKKTNKVISLVLAMLLALSSLPVFASASAVKDDVKTVEALIQPDNLGYTVEWLLKNLNNRKEELVGTVLRFVFMFVEDESLQAKIGKTDIMTASDEKLADILVAWLDANLPTWTADLTEQDWWGIVTKLTPLLGININLSTVKGAVGTLKDLCDTANNKVFGSYVVNLGTLNQLNENALKSATAKNAKNIDIVYALFQWLVDNSGIIKTALKGELKLGIIDTFAEGTSENVNNMIKDYISPAAIKEMLSDAFGLDYETYKSYTADELVAVAFLNLLTGDDSVSKKEAGDVMNLTIYGLLENYAGDIYSNLLLDLLNNDAKVALKELVAQDTTGTIKKVINVNYEFKADTFDAYLGAGKGNMVAQLNNVVITLLEVILTKDAYKALALEKGGNDKLNSNLTKTFRYILPLIKDLDLGVDLSSFTKDKVKNMSAEEMAVAVLKLFFKGWFKNADMKEVNKATTLEQLAVLAAKYAVTNKEWVPMSIAAAKDAVNVDKMSDADCIALLFEIGMETAAKALDHNKSTTYYALPANTADWTGEDYLDDIVDWGLNFVDGLPAAADKLSTERGKLDGEGGFYKLNVVLDSLFDLSFISGCGNGTFNFDIETMLMDKFLGNLLNFDIEAAVSILAENEESSLFNKKVNVAVIDLVDDLITGLFDESYELPATYTLGDVNGDNSVTAADARLALRASVGLENLEGAALKAADADKNNEITAADARLILRASVGLEELK